MVRLTLFSTWFMLFVVFYSSGVVSQNSVLFPFSADIGNPKYRGSRDFNEVSQIYSLKGSRENLRGVGDEFHFASIDSNSGREKKYQVTFGECYFNFLPGSFIRLEVTIKNNASIQQLISQELIVNDSTGMKVWKTIINLDLIPQGSSVIPLLIPVPKTQGRFTLTLGNSADRSSEEIPSTVFNVLQPKKSSRLSKIMVHTPDSEAGLTAFLKTWGIKAPMLSWAQVLLCGRTTWTRLSKGDPETIQMITRALRREMSVIFLDFGPGDTPETARSSIALPFGVTANLIPVNYQESGFQLKSAYPELVYNLPSGIIRRWNGNHGITVPQTELQFEGKGVKVSAYTNATGHPGRFPLVELIPINGKGKLYISQFMTDGRIDEVVQPAHDKPGILAYDPETVQFLLNLISASVGKNLLK